METKQFIITNIKKQKKYQPEKLPDDALSINQYAKLANTKVRHR
jgi:hypothetical protein